MKKFNKELSLVQVKLRSAIYRLESDIKELQLYINLGNSPEGSFDKPAMNNLSYLKKRKYSAITLLEDLISLLLLEKITEKVSSSNFNDDRKPLKVSVNTPSKSSFLEKIDDVRGIISPLDMDIIFKDKPHYKNGELLSVSHLDFYFGKDKNII